MAHLHSQTFTSSGTFIVPAGIRKIYITAIAPGGGGAGGSNNNGQASVGGGGGAGQSTTDIMFAVSSGQSLSVDLGVPGSGGVFRDGNWENDNIVGDGTDGGNLSVGSLGTLLGGGKGIGGWAGHEPGQQNNGQGGSGYPGGAVPAPGISSFSPYGNGGSGGYNWTPGTAGNAGIATIEWDNPVSGDYIIAEC